jgi:hypothetical protein
VRGVGRVALAGLALLAAWTAPAAARASNPFAGWAVIIVAGDWRAHDGGPSEAFDNARRDLAKDFISEGFSPANISQFTARPAADPASAPPARSRRSRARHAALARPAPKLDAGPAPLKADGDAIYNELTRLTRQAPDGCLIYFTSHGNPAGVQIGDHLLPPEALGGMIDQACGDRPTVAIISACFSGVFLPALDGPNRMVLTAARPDRASFGCGQSDRYTYFDGCVLQSLGQVNNFAALGPAAAACVSRREIETKSGPPSEPQTEIGAQLRLVLPLYAFSTPPPVTSPRLSPTVAAP